MADADHGVHAVGDGIGQALGQIELDTQAWVAAHQLLGGGNDKTLAEGRLAGGAESACNGAIERSDLGADIGERIEDGRGAVEQQPARFSQPHHARGAREQRSTEMILKRIDLPRHRGWRRGAHTGCG